MGFRFPTPPFQDAVLPEFVTMVSRNMMYRCSKATMIAKTVVRELIYLSGIY